MRLPEVGEIPHPASRGFGMTGRKSVILRLRRIFSKSLITLKEQSILASILPAAG